MMLSPGAVLRCPPSLRHSGIASEGSSVPGQNLGTKKGAGLSRARLDLVSRYVAAGQGPAPRSPLRFWINGQWVEVSSSEPQPPADASAPSRVAPPVSLSAALEQTPDPPPAALEAVPPLNALRKPHLPIYDWISSGEDDHHADMSKSTIHHDDAAQMAAIVRDFGQRDDHDSVRSRIATLREQRDAGELSYTDFATRVAGLLNRTETPHAAAEGNPSLP